MKWLLKLVPFDTLLESALEKGVDLANEEMAKNGRDALIQKLAAVGKKIAEYSEDTCAILADATIDADERKQLKAAIVPTLADLIKKAVS